MQRIKTVLSVASLLLIQSLPMLAQVSQAEAPPHSISSPTMPSNSVSEQDIEMLREDLRSQRKQITAQSMNLTSEEAAKFWPIYDQYIQAAMKHNDHRWALIKDYAANYTTMTDAKAQDYIKGSNIVDQQLLALRLRYVSAFEKVISPKKAALWYQVDRRIDLLINLQLSAQIPMIDFSK